jgi:hydrogenase nickel incorporation protein HypA/HybF
MHESSLLRNLIQQLETLAREHDAKRLSRVRLSIGVAAGVSPAHLREHFVHAAAGTVAEGAQLDIVERDDPCEPHARDILLESIDAED